MKLQVRQTLALLQSENILSNYYASINRRNFMKLSVAASVALGTSCSMTGDTRREK